MTEISSQIHASMQSFTAHTFIPFLSAQQQQLQHYQQEFVDSIESFQNDRCERDEELARLQQIQSQQKAQLAVEETQTAELDRQVTALELSASTLLPQQIEKLAQKLSKAETDNSNLSKEVDKLTTLHQREIDAVTRGVQMFRDRLGVAFQVADGKLQIVYTLIDRKDASRPFTIAIFVDENKEYQLHACQPELPAIQGLVDSLNSTNNFAKFIVDVRKSFAQSVNGQQ